MRKIYTLFLITTLFTSTGLTGTKEDLTLANKKVKKFLDSTEIARIKTYCTSGTDDCRVLYQRKDKATGKLAMSFYEKFYSLDRGVESICFLILNEETQRYEVYSDLTPDGVIKIDQVLPQNMNVEVSFDYLDFPVVTNLVLSKLGTDSGVKGTMSFSRSQAFVHGNLVQLADPDTLGNEVTVEYFPVKSY